LKWRIKDDIVSKNETNYGRIYGNFRETPKDWNLVILSKLVCSLLLCGMMVSYLERDGVGNARFFDILVSKTLSFGE
jgi:hypothetical protein